MTLKKYYKDPDERKRYTLDYTDWLDLGETITTCVWTVTPVEVGGLTIDASAIVGGTTVVFYASLGLNGEDYIAKARMTSSAGQIKEDTITFLIRSI